MSEPGTPLRWGPNPDAQRDDRRLLMVVLSILVVGVGAIAVLSLVLA